MLDDTLKKIRRLIMSYQTDPNHISTIRSQLNESSRDIIILKETLSYLDESLAEMKALEKPEDPRSTSLFNALACANQYR